MGTKGYHQQQEGKQLTPCKMGIIPAPASFRSLNENENVDMLQALAHLN